MDRPFTSTAKIEGALLEAGHSYPLPEHEPRARGAYEAEERKDAAGDADFEAWDCLFDTDRTITMAGLIALIRYAPEPIDSWGNRADSYDGRDDEPDILAFIADSLEPNHGSGVTLLNLLQLRLGMWVARKAIGRLERRHTQAP
jgi:hypothetical protein